MKTSHDLLFQAVSFAARAHRNQIRKDKETPYVAHVFRVCLVIRQLMGIDDPKILAAAILHDTIEDTPTDYDDIADHVGTEVADWVSILSKDMRMPDATREPAYFAALAKADWQVQVIKMADIYDNLNDSGLLNPEGRKRTVDRNREFLDYIRPHIKPQATSAYSLTEAKLAEIATA